MASDGSRDSGVQSSPAPAAAPPPVAAAAVRPAIDPVGLPNNTLLPLTIRLDRSNFSY